MTRLPVDNTCTYEGAEYECNRDNLVSYMNSEIAAGEVAFTVHTRDFLSESTLVKLIFPPLDHAFLIVSSLQHLIQREVMSELTGAALHTPLHQGKIYSVLVLTF